MRPSFFILSLLLLELFKLVVEGGTMNLLKPAFKGLRSVCGTSCSSGLAMLTRFYLLEVIVALNMLAVLLAILRPWAALLRDFLRLICRGMFMFAS